MAIWAVNGQLAFPGADPANSSALAIDRVHERGARWWLYQLGEPWLGNTLIDDDLPAFTTWGWIAFRYRPDALFYYAVSHYSQASYDFDNLAGITENPATYRGDDLLLNGDGTMLYPGAPYGLSAPIASLRMKALRRGIQDHTLLTAFAALRGAPAADAEAARLIPRALNRFAPGTPAALPTWKTPRAPGTWSRNAWDYESARTTLRQQLPAPPPPAPQPFRQARSRPGRAERVELEHVLLTPVRRICDRARDDSRSPAAPPPPQHPQLDPRDARRGRQPRRQRRL